MIGSWDDEKNMVRNGFDCFVGFEVADWRICN